MKLAIMQPYFLPYLGYFALIKHTDRWIVFDTPQFIRHGWIERNRILKQSGGWQYINVPLVKHKREDKIKDIKIRLSENWQNKIISQLTHYKRIAPYYNQTLDFIHYSFKYETDYISVLNVHLLKEICAYLELKFSYSIYSEMNLLIDPVSKPDEWALNITKAFGANEYYNPVGGISFFDRGKFEKNNINLKFLDYKIKKYYQIRDIFEPGLSIIDVMMFNSKNEINNMLDDIELL